MTLGVVNIRSMAPITLVVHHPTTEDGKHELAKRVADVHAAAVTRRINALICPSNQRLALLDAILANVQWRGSEQH